MRFPLILLLVMAVSFQAVGQEVSLGVAGPFMMNEDVGLSMNRAQVMAAVQEAWQYSFGQEPGAKLVRTDPESGLIEGTARMNYRSSLLMSREETMGVVTYQVTIQANNGQCHVRVHDLRHSGNRSAPGGGIDLGIILLGSAPDKHYPGMGMSASRRLHADVRDAASLRIGEALRAFTARLRLLGEN